MTKKLEAGGITAIVEMGRLAMLMEPVAEDLNGLVIAAPVRRIMIVAETLAKVSEDNEIIAEKLHQYDVMNHLRKEGKLRGSGEVSMPKAFMLDFDRVVADRESSDV